MIKIKTNTNMWTYGWITKYKTYLDKPITASSDIKSTTLYDEEDRIID
jgi:hypothetical protein